MAPSNVKQLAREQYDVAIICPLEVEMTAMRYMLGEEHARLPSVKGDPNEYVFGEMSGHNVVITSLPRGLQGVAVAAKVAADMRMTFPWIKLRMLVGTAGGVPSSRNDIRLGDVVVGMPTSTHSGGVVQYDLGKETMKGFERKGSLPAPPGFWREAAVTMSSDHRVRNSRIASFVSTLRSAKFKKQSFSRPASGSDLCFSPTTVHPRGEKTCKKCSSATLIRRNPRTSDQPSIFYGLIASGSRVVKDAAWRDKIARDGNALCFEMEAAGVVDQFPCVVIRGISNYADSHKNDEWQAFGAAVAAGCAKELLSYVAPVIDRSQLR